MNKLAIVTGASKGIGFALANKLLGKGYTVIGTSRSGNISDISNSNFSALSLDLADSASISSFVELIKNKTEEVGLLINNAGVGYDLDTMSPEEKSYDATFDINVKGTVFLTEGISKLMPSGSKIANISSVMGSISLCGSHDSVAYRMSKSALNMYTKILSDRLAGKIDVASIHPGWVKTTITESCLKHGRLTPGQSAERIVDYIEHQFKNGDYWDAERGVHLEW